MGATPVQSNRRAQWSWALYDWANSAFATVVMAGFFPVFFKQYWSGGIDVTESTFLLGSANSMASVLVVILAKTCVYTVDERETAIITFAGKAVADGDGLHGLAELGVGPGRRSLVHLPQANGPANVARHRVQDQHHVFSNAVHIFLCE